MLLTYVLDKNNDVVYFMSTYSSIQFSTDADLDHSVIKKQYVHVLFFISDDTFMSSSSDAVQFCDRSDSLLAFWSS